MSPLSRFDFQTFCPVPRPWALLAEAGPPAVQVGTPFTLRRVEGATRSIPGRAKLRAGLEEELHKAAGRPILWRESKKGPEVLEQIRHKDVGVSVSYSRREAWLALGWMGAIGVDAVELEEVPDWREVAAIYLEQAARQRLRNSPQPALAFAREWAGFEARLKLAGLSLQEGVKPPPALVYGAALGPVYVAIALAL